MANLKTATNSTSGQRIWSRETLARSLPALIIVTLLALHAWSLMRFPDPFSDEAWLGARAWGFLQTGHPFGVLDAGLVEGYDHYWIVNQWTVTALQSIPLWLAGAPTLLPLRILSLLLGIGLAAVTGWMACQLGGRRFAWLAAVLLSLSLAFFDSAHMARYDILAALAANAGLALMIWERRGRFWPGLFAGLLVGLAVETHLNSLIFIPTTAICLLFQVGWRFWKKGVAWGYGVGLAGGALYFLALHYFPNPKTYSEVMLRLFQNTERPPLLYGDIRHVLLGFSQMGQMVLVALGPLLILAILAIVRIIQLKTREGWLILALNGTLIVSAALVMPNKGLHYTILVAPVFLLLPAFYIRDTFQQAWRGRLIDYARRTLVFGAVAGSIVISLSMLRYDQSALMDKTIAAVQPALSHNEKVMGRQIYWFGLSDHPYLSWELLFLYPRFHPGASVEDAFRAFKPDVIIIDNYLRSLITNTVDPDSYFYYNHLPGKETEAFLARHAELIFEVEDPIRGRVQLYRIRYE